MSKENNPNKLMLINVAGVCHGPQEYARSVVHDRVVSSLSAANVDIKVIFVPSTDVKTVGEKNKKTGVQLPPSRQLERLHEAVEEAKKASRIPVALAHSSGSIAALAALRQGFLPFAVIVSPTFLDPRMELLGSQAFSRRVKIVSLNDDRNMATMWPDKMDYPTLLPDDHFDDSFYWDTIISEPNGIQKLERLLETRVRLFVGQHDWNLFRNRYPELFSAEIIEGETHSFEQNPQSIEKIAHAIVELTEPNL